MFNPWKSSSNTGTPVKRSRPMRVLALGMSRTGTQSVAKALSILGYDRVYHGHDMANDRKEVFLWRDLWRRKYQSSSAKGRPIRSQDFDSILGNCEAVTDAPAAFFWPELMDAYPEAKIVLVERDTEGWYQSFSSVLLDTFYCKRSLFVGLATRLRLLPYNVMVFLPDICLTYFRVRDQREFRKQARTIYEEHNASIRARAQSEGRQILCMTLADGFGPLCEFLDKPVPAVEFPRGNDGATLRKRIYSTYSMLSAVALLFLAGYCAVLALAVLLWKRVYGQ